MPTSLKKPPVKRTKNPSKFIKMTSLQTAVLSLLADSLEDECSDYTALWFAYSKVQDAIPNLGYGQYRRVLSSLMDKKMVKDYYGGNVIDDETNLALTKIGKEYAE